jgi:hypothetical protein
MWTASDAISRTLVWLTVFALPLQAFPCTDCGCASGGVRCPDDAESPVSDCCCRQQDAETPPCCSRGAANKPRCRCSARAVREGRCCFSRRKAPATEASCSASHHEAGGCTCGLNCRCGESPVPVPAAPVSSDRPGEELTCAAAELESSDLGDHRRILRRRESLHADAEAVDSLERCAALCRFTL